MIPSGNITFLFSDIEGSTKLAQKHADTYNDILDRHDTIFKEIIDLNNGFIFKKIGDSFCSSFNNAKDAAKSAIEIQKRLKTEFKGNFELKVRMGIHSGEAEYVNEDYAGYVSLSRAQRIMSIAHGGQILVTQKVHDYILESTDLGISFKDFGKRKLKDIILPEQIYQIIVDGLIEEFPPLKSLDARQTNLPVSLTKFIGRKMEIIKIKKLFSDIRLLTLTGSGGTGKTRFAIQLVSEMIDEFENGIWIIELSPITDPELIVKEISAILNIKEEPGTDSLQTLKLYLKEKKILLILDNCEHLLLKSAQIAENLLSSCPKLKIICTSREALNINGETLFRIPPLSIPENIENKSFEELSKYESVNLFLDRACSVNANFCLTKENIQTVVKLCKKLDGIPLAIELASKRVNVLNVEDILERLDNRFKLLNSGNSTALPRQKTLKALIDWSYDLLNPNEQILLQRLSVFTGGWTLESAEEICSDEFIDEYEILDLLDSLYNKSLVYYNEEKGKGRYGILESIKFYAFEKLSDKSELFHKHLNYFLEFSSFSKKIEKGMNQLEWLNLMNSELDNIRGNIQWALKNEPENAIKLVINTFDFWINKSYLQEGYDSSMKVLNSISISDKKLKADLLSRIARLCYALGRFEELEKFSQEALKLNRETDNKEGIIETLNVLGQKYFIELNIEKSVMFLEEALSLSNEINFKKGKAHSLYNLSFPVIKLGDVDKTVLLREEALKLTRELKDEHSTANFLISLSITLTRNSVDFKKAALYSEESLNISRKIDDQYLISLNLMHLADLKLKYDDPNYEEAEYLLLEAYKISTDFGYNMNLFPLWIHLGVLYIETKKYSSAIKIFKEYLNEREKPGGDFFMNDLLAGFGRIFFEKEDYFNSLKLYGFLESISKTEKFKQLNKNLVLKEFETNKILEKIGQENYKIHWNEGLEANLDGIIEICLNVKD